MTVKNSAGRVGDGLVNQLQIMDPKEFGGKNVAAYALKAKCDQGGRRNLVRGLGAITEGTEMWYNSRSCRNSQDA